jgi:dolichol-phosphate mannosyltransferase
MSCEMGDEGRAGGAKPHSSEVTWLDGLEHLYVELRLRNVPHEIVVVDDGSTDATWQSLQEAAKRVPTLMAVQGTGPHGFGRAIAHGLDESHGDAAVIMMADESDDCRDVVVYWKVYRRTVIDGCRPYLSPHFNLTIELPLKAIVRGYTWKMAPITWRNRRTGTPKLKLKEMGSGYLFICLYVWLEKYFSRGDYRKASD